MSETEGLPAFDVVVIGNAGVDTNVYLYGEDIDWTVEANFSENIDYVGQAGGYSARGYAQLGKRAAFIGHVGADHSGQMVRASFARDGIDTTGLFLDPAGTARSVNIMYGNGLRKNFYDGKGHMTLQPDMAQCATLLRRARLAHFNLPNWARHLLPLAREAGLTVACDLQDVVTVDDPYRRDFIAQADILFLSAVNYEDPAPLIHQFLRQRPEQIVIVGMGARGCAVGACDEVRFFPPVTLPLPVVDTNGAGDGLAVGFLVSFVLEGYSLDDAILRGQIAARHSCAQRGTTDHLITPQQLDDYYYAAKRKA